MSKRVVYCKWDTSKSEGKEHCHGLRRVPVAITFVRRRGPFRQHAAASLSLNWNHIHPLRRTHKDIRPREQASNESYQRSVISEDVFEKKNLIGLVVRRSFDMVGSGSSPAILDGFSHTGR